MGEKTRGRKAMEAHVSVDRCLAAALLVVAACLSCIAAGSVGDPESRQRLEVRRHLKRLNKTPVKSIKVFFFFFAVFFYLINCSRAWMWVSKESIFFVYLFVFLVLYKSITFIKFNWKLFENWDFFAINIRTGQLRSFNILYSIWSLSISCITPHAIKPLDSRLRVDRADARGLCRARVHRRSRAG